jgi:outer membrane protein OmpA-like peptidoglycan-associated protein
MIRGDALMKLHHIKHSIILSGLILLFACASSPQLTRQEIFNQNPTVADLNTRLISSQKLGSEMLAPLGYEKVNSYLKQALEAAQSGNAKEAGNYANKGLKALPAVNQNTATSQDLFVDVLANRKRAITAGAAELFADEFNALETQLRSASSKVENKRIEEAKNRRPGLIKLYSKIELKSIKKGAVQIAKAAIAAAKEKEADDYAQKTFKLAEEELTLALSILEANRNQSKKANAHTTRAIELAHQSIQMTELIKDFDRRDYSEEDKILWYQKQLSTLHAPLNSRLVFDKENRTMVQSITNDIAALVQSEADLRKDLYDTESKVEKLISAKKSELGSLKKKYDREIKQQTQQREALVKHERETRQRFEYVQSLFTENEADVYRKRENILVLAHGFYFEPGKSEIKSINFGLLNKIDQAHNKFPESKLIISGHTDATGNAKTNKRLSEKRAHNVAKFLRDTKGIESTKISVRGYGAERPVATNSTKEGRSRNRRIEVLIENSASL